MIYIFRHYDSEKRIIIYAESYLEAKETLFEFNPWADKTYNILEYKMYDIDIDKFWEVLNIDKESYGYPRILSEKEFEIICNSPDHIIEDKMFNDIHNTKVLTKAFAGEDTNLMSTSEFINALKENADMKDSVKRQMQKMQSIVGDIWKLTYKSKSKHDIVFTPGDTYYIYGLGRQQVLNLYNKQQNKSEYDKIIIKPIIKPNVYDKFNFECIPYSPEDVNEYNILVNYMKKYNIKSFPFDTQEQDKILLKEKAGN